MYFSHERMCADCRSLPGVVGRLGSKSYSSNISNDASSEGEISEDEFRQALEAEFGRPLDPEALKRAAADIFTLNEPMVPLLDRWKRDGYRLVLLSNTCVTHYEWVARAVRPARPLRRLRALLSSGRREARGGHLPRRLLRPSTVRRTSASTLTTSKIMSPGVGRSACGRKSFATFRR